MSSDNKECHNNIRNHLTIVLIEIQRQLSCHTVRVSTAPAKLWFEYSDFTKPFVSFVYSEPINLLTKVLVYTPHVFHQY